MYQYFIHSDYLLKLNNMCQLFNFNEICMAGEGNNEPYINERNMMSYINLSK